MVNFIISEQNPYELKHSPKQYTFDQDKTVHPKITYNNTLKLLKNLFPDKVFSLNKFISDENIHIYNFSDGFYSQNGKGVTINQSKASAIMEYIERYSWLNFDYKNALGYTQDSYNNLSKIYNLKNIPENFNIYYSPDKEELMELIKTIPLDWVNAYSLTGKTLTYYPINWNNINQSSNGLCSGNTREEAIVQGICEVIERHNLSDFILKHNANVSQIIRHDSIQSDVVQGLLEYYNKLGIRIILINSSSPLEVPMIIACGIDTNPEKEIVKIGYGFGCHTDPDKAIIRAITEYTQGRKILLGKKEITNDFDFKTGQWQFRLNLNIDCILKNAKLISLSELPNLSNSDFNVEIDTLTSIFEKNNYDLMIINKTHPQINIPVYRVFCPNLYGVKEMNDVGKSEFFMIVQLYYHAGMDSEAKMYYEKHFKHIVNSFNDMFPVVEYYLNQYFNKNNLLNVLRNNFDMDIIKNSLTPENVPFNNVCKENYIEALKSINHIMKKHADINT